VCSPVFGWFVWWLTRYLLWVCRSVPRYVSRAGSRAGHSCGPVDGWHGMAEQPVMFGSALGMAVQGRDRHSSKLHIACLGHPLWFWQGPFFYIHCVCGACVQPPTTYSYQQTAHSYLTRGDRAVPTVVAIFHTKSDLLSFTCHSLDLKSNMCSQVA